MKFSLHVCVINLYRLSYAVYTLHALCRENANSHMVLLYDIACALHKHLKVHVLLTRVLRILSSYFYMFIIIIGPWTNLEGVTLATPTFHAYDHSAECQVATLYYVIS